MTDACHAAAGGEGICRVHCLFGDEGWTRGEGARAAGKRGLEGKYDLCNSVHMEDLLVTWMVVSFSNLDVLDFWA